MSDSTYWPVECKPGEPDLFVCMDCLEEVFRAKVPVQGCPGCGAVSTFEAFSLDSLMEWGTEDLVQKAQATGAQAQQPRSQTEEQALSTEAPLSSEPQ